MWSLRLLNALVEFSSSLRQRIHLQEELIEAGFDPAVVKKVRSAEEGQKGGRRRKFNGLGVALFVLFTIYFNITLLTYPPSSFKATNN